MKNRLRLHFVVLLWGFTSILGMLISLDAIALVFYRTLIAGIAFAILVKVFKIPLTTQPKANLKLLATGIIISLHWITFFGAARVANISVGLAGISTIALFTAFFEPLFNRKKLQWIDIGLGGVAIVGLYLIFQFEFNHGLGLAIGLTSAALAASFVVLNGQFTQTYHPLQITLMEMIGATITTGLIYTVLQTGLLPPAIAAKFTFNYIPTLSDWGYLLLLALGCTVYAFWESVNLLKYISAFELNLTVNLEPIYGIALAVLWFQDQERMTPGFYGGMAVILLAVMTYPFLKSKAIANQP